MSSPRKPKSKDDTSFWDQLRGTIHTEKGGWVIGEAIHNHGFSMMDDLVGKASYFQVLILNVTGELPERRLADWLEAYFICLSWPDARIWCNQIGSLGGTIRTTPVAAIAAGMMASDSRMYGPGTAIAATEFITEALKKKKKGISAEEIILSLQKRRRAKQIVGFARPVAQGDERIFAMEQVTKKLGFSKGEHLTLAYEIEGILFEIYHECMNIGGYRSAFLSDQGFSSQDIYRIISPATLAGINACYTESVGLEPESFFPLRCDDIDYRGKAPRSVPAGNQ